MSTQRRPSIRLTRVILTVSFRVWIAFSSRDYLIDQEDKHKYSYRYSAVRYALYVRWGLCIEETLCFRRGIFLL